MGKKKRICHFAPSARHQAQRGGLRRAFRAPRGRRLRSRAAAWGGAGVGRVFAAMSVNSEAAPAAEGEPLAASTAPLTFSDFLDKMRQPGAAELGACVLAAARKSAARPRFATQMRCPPPSEAHSRRGGAPTRGAPPRMRVWLNGRRAEATELHPQPNKAAISQRRRSALPIVSRRLCGPFDQS